MKQILKLLLTTTAYALVPASAFYVLATFGTLAAENMPKADPTARAVLVVVMTMFVLQYVFLPFFKALQSVYKMACLTFTKKSYEK